VEWVRNQLALAKSGDSVARRKLLATAVGFVVVVVLLISGQTQSEPVQAVKKSSASGISQPSAFVHLAGQVRKPGVYAITAGMRLFEVLALAGGFTKSADRESVNLARVVVDGEQVFIGGTGDQKPNDGLVHLNQATATELDSLPGIGPTLASRIIDWRETNGSFQNVGDLRKVAGIGDKLFRGVKGLVAP
jgi:competence protein ComEA